MSATPPTAARVLAIVDDPSLRAVLRETVDGEGWSLFEHDRVRDAAGACVVAAPDVVVVQAELHGLDELLATIERGAIRPPVVAIGALGAVEALITSGIADALVVPATRTLLAHRLRRVLRLARVERELQQRGSGPANAAASRDEFLRRVETALAAPRTHRGPVVLLHVSLGLDATTTASASDVERVVLELETRVCDELRARDSVNSDASTSVTTLGNTELVVLLDSLERPQEAYKVARRLRERIGAPFALDGRRVELEPSIGIAVQASDGNTALDLCQSARRAAQIAQQDPARAIRYATAAMDASALERLALESSLRHAIARRELVVHYQPRVDIRTGRIASFEALLRWKHPELGLVSPAQFIPIAEDSGLIVPIGEWVLNEACAQNRRWRAAGLPHVRVAVNLSSVQFRRADVEPLVARALEEAGLEADGLELELTESVLLQDGERTTETLEALREMGVHVAIDDFGTGYSSLSYVKRFPVDALKIDQSFVRDLTSSPEGSAITTSIILMGKSLGLSVVAEGVETKSQLDLLRVLECDEAQGYLFSRPVAAEEATALLARGFADAVAA